MNRDAKLIQNAINSSVIKKAAKKLTGAEPLCKFQFLEDDTTTAKEYLEYAKAAKDLGLTLDVEKLKEVTGLQFISTELAPQTTQAEIWAPREEAE